MAGLDMEDIWSLPVPDQAQQEEVQLMVDGIITRVAPETSQRIDTTAMASVQRKETIKLIRESKAGSDRQEKQAPQGDDAPKTEDVEAGASEDHLAKFFELTQEMVKSQEEAFQKQLADMVGEKHGYPGCFG